MNARELLEQIESDWECSAPEVSDEAGQRAIDALRAVLDRHQSCDCQICADAACRECEFEWPCGTVQAITAALAGGPDA